jgi:hypothetical protein
MDAIYDDTDAAVGLMHFAPVRPARRAMFSARKHLRLEAEPALAAPVPEEHYE